MDLKPNMMPEQVVETAKKARIDTLHMLIKEAHEHSK